MDFFGNNKEDIIIENATKRTHKNAFPSFFLENLSFIIQNLMTNSLEKKLDNLKDPFRFDKGQHSQQCRTVTLVVTWTLVQ